MNNVLILISKGPQYRQLFKKSGLFFKNKGWNVVFALESHYTDYEYDKGKPISNDGATAYYFSDYLTEKDDIKEKDNFIEEYIEFNLKECLIADYDRFATHYNIWDKKDKRKSIKQLICLVNFFEEIINTHNINLILHECAANEFAHVAYIVGKKKKIVYTGIQPARLPNRIEIHDGPNNVLFKKKLSIIGISSQDEYIVNEYIANAKDEVPFYMKSKYNPANVNYIKEYFSLRKINKIFNLIKYRIKYNSTIFNEFGAQKPLALSYALSKRQIKRYFKIKRITRLYDPPNENDCFYIYPVHYEPEASVSVWAKFYIDQINFIRNIAFQIPLNSHLYVKDHKSSRGLLSDSFYKEIKLIPQVKFISPDVDSKKLVLKSNGVITLTSTLGFESLAMRKRVYVFGDVFFEQHPFAVKVMHYRGLFEILRKDIQENPVYKDEYDNFFYEYYINTYPGKFDVYNQDDLLIENVYNAVIDYAKY